MICRYRIQILSIFSVIFIFFISCGNQNEVPNFILPDKIDAFSKNLIHLLNKGEINEIKTFYNEGNLIAEELSKIKIIAQEWENREIKNISIVKINFYEYAEFTEYMAKYLVDFKEGTQFVHIELVDYKYRIAINKIYAENFQATFSSKKNINVFSITYKHIIFSIFAIAYTAIIVYSLILCLKSKIANSRKIVLFLLILLGVVKVNFNWNSGIWGFELLSIGVALPVYRLHAAAPIYVSFYIPIGALLYLINRKSKSSS